MNVAIKQFYSPRYLNQLHYCQNRFAIHWHILNFNSKVKMHISSRPSFSVRVLRLHHKIIKLKRNIKKNQEFYDITNNKNYVNFRPLI